MARIVVGVDGSEESKAALRWAIDEARLRDATVEALFVWHYQMYVAGPALAIPQLPVEDVQRDARETLDRVVDGVLAELGGDRIRVERAAVEGVPARELVEAARGAELLVVGSRGHGGFTGLLLGSVSQQCAQHAPCPIVIVRG